MTSRWIARTGLLSVATIAATGQVLATPRTGDLFVYVEDTSALPSDPQANAKDTLDIDFADVDGDGDLDVFLAEGSGGPQGFQNRLLINDGTGHFVDETAARLPANVQNSTEVDFADIDGDGDLDAAVSNLGANELLINDGAGFFTSRLLPQATPPGPPGFAVDFPPFFIEVSADVSFVDVDSDGDPDLLIANENPFPFGPPGDTNRLLLNDGTGAFAETTDRLPVLPNDSQAFIDGDLDGDGDRDLIELNVGPSRVLMNQGDGTFVDETASRIVVLDTTSRGGALGDLDGDGDLDFVEGNSRGQQNRVYLNDGSGFFVDVTATALPVVANTTTDIDLVDFDGDGDLDMHVSNVGAFLSNHGFLGEPNEILFNDGTGVFTDATFPRLTARQLRTTHAAFGDVDANGTVDMILAAAGGAESPDAPSPDGAERLFLQIDCANEPDSCIDRMLDGLRADVAALDALPAPEGDMTSSRVAVNALRKARLGRVVGRSTAAWSAGRTLSAALGFEQIIVRTDGAALPLDWVVGNAAERLVLQARFGKRVLLASQQLSHW